MDGLAPEVSKCQLHMTLFISDACLGPTKWLCTHQTCSLDPSNPSLSIQVGMTVKSPVWQLFFVNKSTYKTDYSHFNAWCIRYLKSCKTDLHDVDEEAIQAGLHGVAQTENELNETGQSWLHVKVGMKTYQTLI